MAICSVFATTSSVIPLSDGVFHDDGFLEDDDEKLIWKKSQVRLWLGEKKRDAHAVKGVEKRSRNS